MFRSQPFPYWYPRFLVPRLLGALVLLVALFSASPAHALGVFEDLLKNTCPSQVGSMPISATLPRNRMSAVVHAGLYVHNAPAQCNEFTWVRAKGTYLGAMVRWAGVTQVVCGHSTLSWSVYRKNTNGTWSWVTGGHSYGSTGANGTCNYDMTAFPQSANWGTFGSVALPDQTYGEYRVAFSAWAHNHDGTFCADPNNCYYPVKITFGGQPVFWKQDFVTWRPSNGTWYFRDSTTNVSTTTQWGANGDVPLAADFDGDNNSDFAVWRPSNGTFYVIRSSDGVVQTQNWGQAGDVPVPADYDGDQKADYAIWRPSDGNWWVLGSLRGNVGVMQWGTNGDKPIPMMHDDDLHADTAVFRPNGGNGFSYWHIWDTKTWSPTTVQWGLPGDVPFAANFGAFALFFPAVFRPSTSGWYASNGTTATGWGSASDIPVVSDYDGNGIYNFGFYRPSNGAWWSHNAPQANTSQQLVLHGASGDIPIAPFHRGDGWPP